MTTPSVPATRREPVVDTLHGVPVTDEYRWLEDGSDSAAGAWTSLQNRVARTFLDSLPQRGALVSRLTELTGYDRQGMPFRVPDGTARFFYRRAKDREKAVSYVQENETAPARVIFDENELPEDEQLLSFAPSRDGRYVALGIARGGSEDARVRVLVTATGDRLPDTLRGARQCQLSWVRGDTGFYYTATPRPGEVPAGEENYWYTVWFHRLGTPADRDVRVFGHDSVKEYVHACAVSHDGGYVGFVRADMAGRSELYVGRPDSSEPPVPVATGFDAQYNGEVVDSLLLVMTNAGAPMGRVYVTPAGDPARENWREFVPELPDARLVNISPAGGRVYLTYERDAHTAIRVHDIDGRFLRELALPTLGSASVGGLWQDDEVRVHFSSFTWPGSDYHYDYDADSLVLFFRPDLGVDFGRFVTEQAWLESRDGTRVPMFIVRPRGLERDGRNPVLLTGYGGFGISMTPSFGSSYLAWLEAGGVVAVANLRGGGEYGEEWHAAGMLEGRQRVFEDFLAAAEWLVDSGYTGADRLAAYGGSNGGLTVGAAMVQRPELFRAVVLDRPILDMLRYHRFGPAGMWVNEYGSADDPEQFRYLAAYSPYHNVEPGADYPAVAIFGSENDYRADPGHARKMAARLQAAGPGPVLLHVERASGHFGGTTHSTRVEQQADRYAFLMAMLGMTPRP